jgi:outer membrane murein-binding lipoprotein Lpp
MSDETKEKTFEFPMMPIFGVDLGERLGELSAGQKQLGSDIQRLDARMDRLDARMDKLDAKIDAVDGRVDQCRVAINRMDERINSLAEGRKTDHNLLIGLWVTVVAGFILNFFIK